MVAKFRILSLVTAMLALLVCSSCSDSSTEVLVETDNATSILNLRIRLARSTYSSRAPGDELPANLGERMQTLRIIILNGNSQAEYNQLWNLNAPAVDEFGTRVRVSSNDIKTIILVANEAGAIITDSAGNKHDAATYFDNINANFGSYVDVDELRKLTMVVDDNKDENGWLRTPLVINDIHTMRIGEAPEYFHSFWIERAASKYTFRITNKDMVNSHTLTSLTISRVASAQYFFPKATYGDDAHTNRLSYSTPAGVTTKDVVLTINRTIAKGETIEVGPFYVPEGLVFDDAYKIGIAIDGDEFEHRNIAWRAPESSDPITPMTDLPRNSHVVSNITLNYVNWSVDYTVCPWDEHTINIPSFN